MPRPDEPDHVAMAREAYDHAVDRYLDAVGTTVSAEFETTIDLAALRAFATDLATAVRGSVIDVGCGPGRVTRLLADHGLDVRGVDVSVRMVEAARTAHPDLRFDVASLTDLPAADRSMAGVVSWYSIITTPLDRLGEVWREFDRVLVDAGRMLVAFQAGDGEVVERSDDGSPTLRLHRHRADAVATSLDGEGFEVVLDLRRAAALDHETTPQAILIARRARG
ncbi:class I SAM-dependent methyltransferase [Ilumatobacter sp.]|uniref:class I SAM-dependent methyltransferase n=1 Tax=Ilumatobacter sp. TaxID=1967498 RepID=UPI003B5287E0